MNNLVKLENGKLIVGNDMNLENKILVINPDEISKEIIDVLVKHKVTMVYLD